MKTELEIQKDFIENPELKSQIDFLKSGKMQNLSGPVFVDALVSGMRDIKKLIDENTYRGLEAKVRFNTWRKVDA